MTNINNPVSTYRVQLHKSFNFKDLEDIAEYLYQLGIKTVYASPVFESMPGSTHGYDGTDPNTINPEIGSEEQLIRLSGIFTRKRMLWLQDIVPNHLSFHEKNKWLMDVLAKDKDSEYADFFDIIHDHPVYGDRLMVPFPGSPLETYLKENIPGEEHYVLTDWRETEKVINYRRFFTVNSLICTNVQYEHVFSRFHELIGRLVARNIFHGLRVDHIDGLYDPREYLIQLRKLAGEQTYIVVEKILEPEENMPDNWEVQGTSGYEFLGMVNNLFTNRSAEKSFSDLYFSITGDSTPVPQQIREKKSYILFNYMNGELDNLVRLYKQCGGGKDMAEENIRSSIAEYLISCPVYRYYGKDIPMMKQDQDIPADGLSRFYQRAMQFTGPLMAKGVEDTLMYTYNRFIGHNEVGDSPESFGLTAEAFHTMMAYRNRHWPLSLNTTSTHDTKRGEDARARLNVLTDLSDEWIAFVQQWRQENKPLKINGAPDDNDEYFIYQTIMATLPYPDAENDMQTYRERIQQYLQKALREAKLHSGWSDPDTGYESAAIAFAHAVIDNHHSFTAFLQKVADLGIVNSLSQLILKFTCPGVPDTYQGTELWDLSLVDPDNRRAVDYAERKRLLATAPAFYKLWPSRKNGHIKLALLHQLLKIRNSFADIFTFGDYIPVSIEGAFKENVIAFLRLHNEKALIVVLPLHISQLTSDPLKADWKDTRLLLPENLATTWKNLLTGQTITDISLNSLFELFPAGVLVNQ